ncbi:MAG: hypothetical protein HY866_20745 [Chloroflexi bacterium]|nr:hypothetical protein [Chloroflexota bacterium]
MGERGAQVRDQIFDYLIIYKRQHQGLSPLVKEIAHACQLSQSTVKYHLLVLEKEQRIHRVGRRAIEIPGEQWDWHAE